MMKSLNGLIAFAAIAATPAAAKIATVNFTGTGVVTNATGPFASQLGLAAHVSGKFTFSDGSDIDGDAELPSDFTGSVSFKRIYFDNGPAGYNIFEAGFPFGGVGNYHAVAYASGFAVLKQGIIQRFNIYSDDGSTAAVLTNADFFAVDLYGHYIRGTWSSVDYPFLASIPEPATWAMMIAGFGLVGAGMRRVREGRTANAVTE